MRQIIVLAAVACAAACLAPSVGATDASLKATFLKGVNQINTSTNGTVTETRLRITRAVLAADTASTAKGRAGKAIALEGFGFMLQGMALIDDAKQAADEGDLGKSVAIATKINHLQMKGAALLKGAGPYFGVKIHIKGFN